MKFNINNCVKVKLTEVGIGILKKQHADLKTTFPKIGEFKLPEVDNDGYSKFQLHDLMTRFGSDCFNDYKLPFETEIIIEEK